MKKSNASLILIMIIGLSACMWSCKQESVSEKKLIEEGTLYMATSAYFPPYEYYVGDKIVGIDAEIGQAIANKMGVELVIRDMTFDDVLNSVKNGENDIAIAALTITDERKEEVDFSEAYAYGIQSVIVKEDSSISSVEDLANAGKIGVHKGSTGEAYCIEDFGENKIESYNKVNIALLDLDSEIIDAFVIDHDVAVQYVGGNSGLKMLNTDYLTEEYGIAVTKGNEALVEEINAILKEMEESGELNTIINKYMEMVE